MRLDYMMYTVAVIFFILTGIVAVYVATQRELWIISTIVIGVMFLGFGIIQRPKETTTLATTSPPPPPPTAKVTEPVMQRQPEPQPQPIVEAIAAPQAASPELLKIKGIGEKRLQQLGRLGINTVSELAKASPKEIAAKLQISPKITGNWIQNAKAIVEKS